MIMILIMRAKSFGFLRTFEVHFVGEINYEKTSLLE